MKNPLRIASLAFLIACTGTPEVKTTIQPWTPYDQSAELEANAEHESRRMRYKLIQSQVTDKNGWWEVIQPQIAYIGEGDYQRLTPLIYDRSIPEIQAAIENGNLTYEELTQWYLFRIARYENDSTAYLNNIISINPDAVEMARQCDRNKSDNNHPLFGMPVLLKDNVNFGKMPTTAGTHLLRNNVAENAFIVDRIQSKGGIILGKTTLSEWANFLCLGCPNGYSAVGGQTLNPYGRKIFDTGGSSSGSGSAIAANYAVAAVGTETSGSILSPSSSNSLVGLKPTTGLLSRGGIVPLSSTLDTPGPMTKSIIDNAIFLSALTGEDPSDHATAGNNVYTEYWKALDTTTLEGKRFGVNKQFLQDSLYRIQAETIASMGADTIHFLAPQMDFSGFSELLSADMRVDLPAYLAQYATDSVSERSIEDIVAYNYADSSVRIPYGQGRFERILEVAMSAEELDSVRMRIRTAGKTFFETIMAENNLDFVLSINNWNAGHAAAANYPCLTIPMGYTSEGQPMGLTLISRPYEELKLLKAGYVFEQATKARKAPVSYP